MVIIGESREEEIWYDTPGKESVPGGTLLTTIFNHHYCYHYYVTVIKFCMGQSCFTWRPLFEWKYPFDFIYILTKSNVKAHLLIKQSTP